MCVWYANSMLLFASHWIHSAQWCVFIGSWPVTIDVLWIFLHFWHCFLSISTFELYSASNLLVSIFFLLAISFASWRSIKAWILSLTLPRDEGRISGGGWGKEVDTSMLTLFAFDWNRRRIEDEVSSRGLNPHFAITRFTYQPRTKRRPRWQKTFAWRRIQCW